MFYLFFKFFNGGFFESLQRKTCTKTEFWSALQPLRESIEEYLHLTEEMVKD
jgi:hypothetical protein